MDLISTAALLVALDGRRRPSQALRDALFPTGYQSESEEIVFDDIDDDLMIAAYVSPDVASPDSKLPLETATSFKPAYVKPKHSVKPSHGLKRRPGEPLFGNRTSGDRLNEVIESLLIKQDDMISRVEEMQASEILRTGQVVITGENYATRTVSFNRDAGLTEALVGAAQWGQPGVSIIDFLEDRADRVSDASGATITDVILGSTAASTVRKDTELRETLDLTRQANGSYQLGPVTAGGDNNHLVFLGEIGDFRFWKYRQKFRSPLTGSLVDVWPSNGCALVSPETFNGFTCHGAILDRMADLEPLSRFPKMFDENDPPQTSIMTQSSPLLVPADVNASYYATVI